MTDARCITLLGEDHPDLGEVAAADLGPDLALALSRGRFRKWYPYVDPNEDAVVAARAGSAILLAAIDGHHGFEAARATAQAVTEHHAALLSDPGPGALGAVLVAAHRAVTDALAGLEPPRVDSATAVTLVVATPGRAWVSAVGDTVAVRAERRRCEVVSGTGGFLDPRFDPADATTADLELRSGDVVLVASDGIVDFLGRRWERWLAATARAAPDMRTLVDEVVGAAFAGGAGDNVCAAAWRHP